MCFYVHFVIGHRFISQWQHIPSRRQRSSTRQPGSTAHHHNTSPGGEHCWRRRCCCLRRASCAGPLLPQRQRWVFACIGAPVLQGAPVQAVCVPRTPPPPKKCSIVW